MNIVFASGNKGKIKEIKDLFSGTGYDVISLFELGGVPDITEDGSTFEENAKKKAFTIYENLKVPIIADDSGLAVDQLNGAPGVYSARYAGDNVTYEDNNNKLIKELWTYSEPHPAKFICCAVYFDGKTYLTATGELPGRIIKEFRGEHGFGYDPIFVPEGYDRTLAELSLEEKNRISHRAKAFNKLKKLLTGENRNET
ncbi:MAG: RdgB/HAM1 family non-canonical purine NTP pyrophosphatase [Ignavibacteriales bacterium]